MTAHDAEREAGAVAALLAREIADDLQGAISSARADVRCLDCGIRYAERQDYGCGEDGRGHDRGFLDSMLADAEAEARQEPREYVTLSIADLREAIATDAARSPRSSEPLGDSDGGTAQGPSVSVPESPRSSLGEVSEAAVEAWCAAVHPDLNLSRHPESDDPRHHLAACYQCQRGWTAALPHLAVDEASVRADEREKVAQRIEADLTPMSELGERWREHYARVARTAPEEDQ